MSTSVREWKRRRHLESGLTSGNANNQREDANQEINPVSRRRSLGQFSRDSGFSGSSESGPDSSSDSPAPSDEAEGPFSFSDGRKSSLKNAEVRKAPRVHWADEVKSQDSHQSKNSDFKRKLQSCIPFPKTPQFDPVDSWLKNLHSFYYPESTCALQNKSLPAQETSKLPDSFTINEDREDATTAYEKAKRAQNEVAQLQKGAHIVATKFTELCLNIEARDHKKFPSSLHRFVARLIRFFRESVSYSWDEETKRTVETIREICSVLLQLVVFGGFPVPEERLPESGGFDWFNIRKMVAVLGHYFVMVVDGLVKNEVQVFIEIFESTSCLPAVKLAVLALASIGCEYTKDTVNYLLVTLKNTSAREIHVDIIRSLTLICSSVENVEELHKVNGLEVLLDILRDPGSRYTEKLEVTALLVQITAIWMENRAHFNVNDIFSILKPYLKSLIHELKGMISDNPPAESFLLVSAVLANLSAVDHSDIGKILLETEIFRNILKALRRTTVMRVFIYEQVATVIFNIVQFPKLRLGILEQEALGAITLFLEFWPEMFWKTKEKEAWERLVSKSTMTISRICDGMEIPVGVVSQLGVVSDLLENIIRNQELKSSPDCFLGSCQVALKKLNDTLDIVKNLKEESRIVFKSKEIYNL